MDDLTPQTTIDLLALRLGISETEAKRFFQTQAEMAAEFADRGFVIPGIGRLRTFIRPERKFISPVGAMKGQEIKLAAKRVIHFRVSSVVKEAIHNHSKSLPDVSTATLFDDHGEAVSD